ncbi:hypothetical protein P7K49_035506, partial [Saguinus oedipus]
GVVLTVLRTFQGSRYRERKTKQVTFWESKMAAAARHELLALNHGALAKSHGEE